MRYLVGIDLGTTHSALSYLDAEAEGSSPVILPVPQLVAKGVVGSESLLPSFVLLPPSADHTEPLPWDETRRFAVGTYARKSLPTAPERVVASAKSWLSQASVHGSSVLLPLVGEGEKLSPLDASAAYLAHLGEVFYRETGEFLAAQTIVLTVPASFDAAARELTLEAARRAGLTTSLTLLEEPQAALYAWTEGRGGAFRKELSVGDRILVVDVGGGTTDFSAILVGESEGALSLERIAVGDHILLGGDNMDLLLGHVVAQKLLAEGKTLDAWQRASLAAACREAKEKLLGDRPSTNPALGDAAPSAVPVVVPSRGSNLFGGTLRSELSQEDVAQVILAGFFPGVRADAQPKARPRGALTQLGLSYAQDASITAHLAAFLSRHQFVPTKVLFNGGPMKSPVLRGRLLETLRSWVGSELSELPFADYDLAVARGAAVYARAKAGRGVRIRSATAQAYYVGIESNAPTIPGFEPPVELVCIAPFGMEEGAQTEVASRVTVGLVVGEPVQFRFFSSSTRRADVAGTVVSEHANDVVELAPIEVTLPASGRPVGSVVPVSLGAGISEIGLLELFATPRNPTAPGEQFKVELSVRDGR